jgi:ribosomal protein S12 methylthiotransferase
VVLTFYVLKENYLTQRPTVSLISLGCAKNTVDSEVLLGVLNEAGYPLVADYDEAKIVLVNTCCFIEPAVAEATEMIRALEARRKDGSLSTLIVTGCLPQRYRDQDLTRLFPWVDAFIGPGDVPKIASVLDHCLENGRISEISAKPTWLYDHRTPRVRVTHPHLAYVKIAEGCSHRCSFCLIPGLRGSYRSRRMKSVVEEVRWLASDGRLREINVIAQDTTAYGWDLYGRPRLYTLLKRIAKEDLVPWIRLLYTYPRNFNANLIDLIASEESICNYVDLPLQHCSDRILKSMRRGVTKRKIVELLQRLRDRIPELTIRTTFIVGFPGETDKDFRELVEFISDQQFERMGVFPFWPEEGAPASAYPDQVPDEVKEERLHQLMVLQQAISAARNQSRIGEIVDVLVDSPDENEPAILRARTEGDAYDVDGAVLIPGGITGPGEFTRVRITGASEYDLVGEEVSEVPVNPS